MDFNKLYEKDLEFIQNELKKAGKPATDAAICVTLGKNGSFLTNKRSSKSGFTREDYVWLHYIFGKILEKPIVKNTEAELEKAEQRDLHKKRLLNENIKLIRRLS